MCKIFKGFILGIILVILISINDKVFAADAYFVWEKTVIDVPVNSSLEEYKDDYVLKLYVNGEESNDFYVEYETNCSTFTTVITNRIGKYSVYYKAYSKNNYISSEQRIVFNVVDITPPTIEMRSDYIEIAYGTKLSDSSFYTLFDDTCEFNDLSVTIDDSSVIYTNLGLYSANILAVDLYGNTTIKEFKVKIIDNTPPNIIIKKPLVFDYLENINWTEYIKCQDNYDNDVTNLVNVTGVDTKKLGKCEITLTVKDYSNNEVSVILEGNILDKTGPIINLIEEEITLDINDFELYDENYFKDYIYNYSDNYSKEENITLNIDISSLTENVLDFIVNFILIDENNNQTVKSILVKLREFSGPEISGPEFIDINIGDEVDLYELVTVTDDYDNGVLDRLVIDDGGFDNEVAGQYKIKYTTFNTSGIYTEKIIVVNVIKEEEKVENNMLPTILIIGGISLVGVGLGLTIFLVRRKRRFH